MQFKMTNTGKVLLDKGDTFFVSDTDSLRQQLIGRQLPLLEPMDDEAAAFLRDLSTELLTAFPAPSPVAFVRLHITESFRATEYFPDDPRVFAEGDVVDVSHAEYRELVTKVADKIQMIDSGTNTTLATYLVEVGGDL